MALRAAITGHLVLATLHTYNVPSTIERLLDLGAEKFMLIAALKMVMSQRLVKVIMSSMLS